MKKIKQLITLALIIPCFLYALPANTQTEEEQSEETVILTSETASGTPQEEIQGTNNFITVQYLNDTIFNGLVFTTSTYFKDDANNEYFSSSPSALGALANASRIGGFPLTIKNGWGSYYVSAIGQNEALGFDGWIYSVNMSDPGYTAMNDYLLCDNDQLSVYYSLWPWKITASTSSAQIGDNIIFTSYQYASSMWSLAPSTSISINNEIFTTNQNGEYSYLTTASGTLKAYIYGSEAWAQNSPAVEILINDRPPTSTSSSTNSNNENSGGSGNGTENVIKTEDQINSASQKLLNFIKSNQDESGKILDGNISDWAIMSFAAAGNNPNLKLTNYSFAYDFSDSSDLNLCASYPRHLLALKSAGYQNDNEQIQKLFNYIKNDCYKNSKYGQEGINDDVFGLIALLNTGMPANDPIITGIISSIKLDQTNNGAFTWGGYEGADITGAVINALKYAEDQGVVVEHEIYSKAKNYLKNTQLDDGGWGYGTSDVLTTSWVIMGINSLKENQNNWFKNGKNPWYILIDNLKDDGSYKSTYSTDTIDWFAVKHALPALKGASWPVAPISLIYDNKVSGVPEIITTSTPTTTIEILPTSTIEIVTTTLPLTTTTIFYEEPANSTTTNGIILTANDAQTSSSTKPKIKILLPKKSEILNLNSSTQNLSSTAQTTTKNLFDPKELANKTLLTSGLGAVLIGIYLGLKLIKNLL